MIKDRLVTSLEKARQLSNLEGLGPFEVTKEGKKVYMAYPTNMEELIKESYLYVLIILANKINKVTVVKSKKAYKTTMLQEDRKEDFLKGFGVPLVKGVHPTFTQTRGNFGKGIHCAVKYKFQHTKGFDLNITKVRKVESAPTFLFGDLWGSKNITDKRLVDNIINALKTIEWEKGAELSWIKPKVQIVADYGLNAKLHENQLLSIMEQQFIIEDFKKERYNATIPDWKEEMKDVSEISMAFQRSVKAFKPYKEFVNDIINSRLRAIYSQKENKGRKRKQLPIKQLVDDLKNTKVYLDVFNPCRAAQVVPPFNVPFYPENAGEYDNVLHLLTKWEKAAKVHEEKDSLRVLAIKQWFIANLAK
jgi:hypothetical protein